MNDRRGSENGRGLLVVISGFSGAGKSCITKGLLKAHPETYAYSVSATTRKPRPGETEGVDYFYIDVPAFEKMIERGELLEHNRYVGNYYGTLKTYVEEKISEGYDVILEIDVNGAAQIRRSFPNAVTLFIVAKSACDLKKRLSGRGTEPPEIVKKRLSKAVEESYAASGYDYVIINDDLEKTVVRVDRLIQDQHMRAASRQDFMDTFRKEMEELIRTL